MIKLALFTCLVLLSTVTLADPLGYKLINKKFNIDKVLKDKTGITVVNCSTYSWVRLRYITSDKLGVCLYQDFLRKKTRGLEQDEIEMVFTTNSNPDEKQKAKLLWIPIPASDNFRNPDYSLLRKVLVYELQLLRIFTRPLNHILSIEFDHPVSFNSGPLKHIIPFFLERGTELEKITFSHTKIENKDPEWNYFGELAIYSDKMALPDYTISLDHDFRFKYLIKKIKGEDIKLNTSLKGESPKTGRYLRSKQ